MENLLSRANEAFVAYLDKNEGKEINIAELIGDYVCTVTTVLVCGSNLLEWWKEKTLFVNNSVEPTRKIAVKSFGF